jgi:hypothetical protein
LILRRRRSTKRRTALCIAAALSLLAIGGAAASSAQAFEWEAGGRSLVGGNVSSAPLAGEAGTFNISSHVLGAQFTVSCVSLPATGSLAPGGGGAATVDLSGCVVAEPATCSLKSSSKIEANVHPLEVGGKTFLEFEATKNILGELAITGGKCPLAGNTVRLKGSAAGSAAELSEETVVKSMSFSEAINLEAGLAPMKVGTEPATVSGSLELWLGSPLIGKWRALASNPEGGGVPNAWHINGLKALSKESVSVSGGPVSFQFSMLGTSLTITCSETGAREMDIVPGGTTETGSLTFSGCAFTDPSNCGVNEGQISTPELTGTVFRSEDAIYETFAPTTPNGPLFEIQPTGANCSLAGWDWRFKGSFTGLGRYLGISSPTQPIEFSAASNAIAGSELVIGAEAGQMTGSFNQRLINGNSWSSY